MRTPLTISILLHVCVAVISFVGWPLARPAPTELPDVLPVELVTIGDYTSINKRKAPEKKPPAEPEPKKVVAPEPEPEPAPPPPPKKAEPPPPPPPEKKKVEKAPEKPKEEEKKAEPKPIEKPKPKPKVAKPAEPEKPRFNADRIAALLDKMPQKEEPKAPPPAPVADETFSSLQMVSLTDAFNMQMEPCWSPNVGSADAQNQLLTVMVVLNRDGTVVGRPQVTQSSGFGSNLNAQRAAEGAAVRAILRCQPYSLPPDMYIGGWQELELGFDPSKMF